MVTRSSTRWTARSGDAPAHDDAAAAWIDGVEDGALVGWLYWPVADDVVVRATVDGEPAEVVFHPRPDVGPTLGLSGHAHGFTVAHAVRDRLWSDSVALSFSIDDPAARLDLPVVHVGALLVRLLGGAMQGRADGALRRVLASDLTGARAPSGYADAAREETSAAARWPGGGPAGPRQDLVLSAYQRFAYDRHVRGHPAYRTARHFTLATRDAVIDYLRWSLRNHAGNYPFAPLPLGPEDLVLANEPVHGTGLAKGHGGALVDLPLTRMQRHELASRGAATVAGSEDELADWLLRWLGSWGWGHRGRALLTSEQLRFLRGAPAGPAPSIGEVTSLNAFVSARQREHDILRGRYGDLKAPHVRLALMLDLLVGELVDVGTACLLPPAFLALLAAPAVQQDVLAALEPSEAVPGAPVSGPRAARRTSAVRVVGMLESASGLGQNARNSLAALRSSGHDADHLSLSVNDRSVQGRSTIGAELEPAPVNLIHMNPDNVPEALSALDRRLFEDSYNIGFFAWELDLQPTAHSLGISLVDEIWVPSEYCAASFRRATDKPVVVMPHAVVLPADHQEQSRADLGLPEDCFLVHYSFDMHSWPQRKNPLGVLWSFQEAFPDDPDVRLLLKVRNGLGIGAVDSDLDQIGTAVLELAREDPRVLVDVEERSYSRTLAMLAASDCHMSLHRSEGFGYSLAESMLLGVPLICSDYGGSRDFCTDETAWLVPAQERYLHEGEYYLAPPGARWGEPDLSAAVDALRDVRRGGPHVVRRTATARSEASSSFALQTLARRYDERLAVIGAGRSSGQDVAGAAQRARPALSASPARGHAGGIGA